MPSLVNILVALFDVTSVGSVITIFGVKGMNRGCVLGTIGLTGATAVIGANGVESVMVHAW